MNNKSPYTPDGVRVTHHDNPQHHLTGVERRWLKRILVPVDFNYFDSQTVEYAYSLAPAGSTVYLLHILHPEALPGSQYVLGVMTWLEQHQHRQLARTCTSRLRKLKSQEAETRGIITIIEVTEHRDPATAICEVAERTNSDVICFGIHGWPRLALFQQDALRKVIIHSLRPVLMVPCNRKPSKATPTGQATCTTDFTP